MANPSPPARAEATGIVISATSGDIHWLRMAARRTRIVARPAGRPMGPRSKRVPLPAPCAPVGLAQRCATREKAASRSWFEIPDSSCPDAKGERCCGKRQHECGRPNAFDIADTQMGHDGSHEIEDETDSRGDSD